MKAMLICLTCELYHCEQRERKTGVHPGLHGDCSGIWGDCTGLHGDLDECEITDNDRKTGIKIESLIAPEDQRREALLHAVAIVEWRCRGVPPNDPEKLRKRNETRKGNQTDSPLRPSD